MSDPADGNCAVETRQLTWVNASVRVTAQAVPEEQDRKSNNSLTVPCPIAASRLPGTFVT
jgi:hypothetical protein